MTKLDHALALAAAGFWVFPIEPNGKRPAQKGWQQWATRDAEKIRAHWAQHPGHNIGISTSRYLDDQALLVLDIDKKNGKDGSRTLLGLELAGFDLPDTRGVSTPSGGSHLFFRVPHAVRQGANVLGPGLDVRSRGGYVLGAGSEIDGRAYGVCADLEVQPAPQWLIDRCAVRNAPRAERVPAEPVQVDQSRAVERGVRFLTTDAPLAVEGEGGDETTYKVAARLKDFGVDLVSAVDLLWEHWNPRCSPPWSAEDLTAKVRNAYAYGQEPVGAAAPEAEFKPVAPPADAPAEAPHPFDKLNLRFAVLNRSGSMCVLHETTDVQGHPIVQYMSRDDFAMLLEHTPFEGKPISVQWRRWRDRREYVGTCFLPERQPPDGWFNLWKGFAVEALDRAPTTEEQRGLDAWLEHARQNVCGGNEHLLRWLVGYFAHMIQRPWEKPLTALVFKGGKGTGKNALVERVGHLLGFGTHFMVLDDPAHLLNNFNDHLEKMLFVVLDEAVWAGDKKAEGRLKGLITGKQHVIEPKFGKKYAAENLTRVALIGNEDWLVPATKDERRFAVFSMGDGRRKDNAFFKQMRLDMERGGYRLLLSYLKGYDLSGVDLDSAPSTDALLEQKHATLEPFPQWWLACLTEGKLAGGDFDGWPGEAECERLRGAFRRHARDRGIRSRLPDDRFLGRELKAWGVGHKKTRANGYVYVLPDLAAARAKWSAWIGHDVGWGE